MIVGLDFRTRDRGGPVVPGRFVDAAALGLTAEACERAVREAERLVVLVHGFNVERSSGTIALTRLARAVDDAGLVAIVVTWPGDGWGGPLGYPLEGHDADDAGAELARTIDRVGMPGVSVAFVAHSLGARVAFEAARRLDPSRVRLDDICVLAAAVDDTALNDGTRYHAPAATARTTVVASRRDAVLRWAYPAGDAVQAALFAWRDRAGRALGFAGPRAAGRRRPPPTVRHVQIPDAMGVGHGDYLTSSAPNDHHRRTDAFVRALLRGAAPAHWPDAVDSGILPDDATP